MPTDASFRLDADGLLVPGPGSVSVWSNAMVNGHQIGGLVAWGSSATTTCVTCR